MLDFSINEGEVIAAIKKLKNRKSEGPDSIKNEMLKCAQHVLTPVFVKLFNINTSTKVLIIDYDGLFFIFLIFHYRIALCRWKPCSIVYSYVKCQMQSVTHNPTALLTVPLPPISHQHKVNTKSAFNANTTMFIKFICLTKSLTKGS